MQGLRLYKSEKLCSRTAVERLFEEGQSVIAYPLRAVFRLRESAEVPAQFLITIPKKRIRHAVDRVLMRRRVREAYRLSRRELLHPALTSADRGVDIAFLYLSNDVINYRIIADKMSQLLQRIAHDAIDSKS